MQKVYFQSKVRSREPAQLLLKGGDEGMDEIDKAKLNAEMTTNEQVELGKGNKEGDVLFAQWRKKFGDKFPSPLLFILIYDMEGIEGFKSELNSK